MELTLKAALCCALVLFGSDALAVTCPDQLNWGGGTLNLGEVIPDGNVVRFTYWNNFINANGTVPVNPANLGPFTANVPGFLYDAKCNGLVPTTIPVAGYLGDHGYVRPKYQVVGVYYAPPGSKSTVTYGSSFSAGTTTSTSSSFNVASNVSLTISDGVVGGVTGDTAGGTVSFGWGYGTTNSSSTTLTSTQGNNLTIPGPASSENGIDHSEDLIWVWLDPSLGFDAFPGAPLPILWTSVNYDSDDPAGMDVYPLSVAQLKTLAAGGIPTGLDMTRLDRGWSQTGALTPQDYSTMLAADPFVANPSFNPSTDTTHRFDAIGQTINYTPAGTGGQPIATAYTSSYQTTSTNGKTATNTYSVSVAFDGSVSWEVWLKTELKAMTTWTWTDMWGSSLTTTNIQSANFSITSPLPTDGYTGPTAITVWKDNVYGSFMFFGAL
jgi:hypothetical protein